MLRQSFETGEVVDGQKVVDERQSRLHAAGERLIRSRSEQRIQPDEAMTAPLKPAHLALQEIGFAAVPAVRDQQHDRPASQNPPRPPHVERPQRFADPRATRPVRHPPLDLRYRLVDTASRDLASDARQSRREEECRSIRA